MSRCASDQHDTGADGEAARARPLVEIEVQRRISSTRAVKEVRRAYTDTWRIDAMHYRGQLTDQHWEAGRRFRTLWCTACGEPHVIGTYGERVIGGSLADTAAHVEQSRHDLGVLLRELGQIRSTVVISVCGMDEPVSKRGVILRQGLDVLALWWDIPADFRKLAISY